MNDVIFESLWRQGTYEKMRWWNKLEQKRKEMQEKEPEGKETRERRSEGVIV